MTITTVSGKEIKLSKCSGYSLNYVIQCGKDWIADISMLDGKIAKNNKKARVFVSQNSGVATLMSLAMNRGELKIL